MENEHLARRNHDLTRPSEISLTASQQTLAVELNLTALNAKTLPASELTAEFDRVFSAEPRAAIEWAFRQWRNQSEFFPTVKNIRELIATWHRARADEKRAREEREEREQAKAAREKGQLIDFATIANLCAKVSAAQGKPTPTMDEMAKPMEYTPPSREELESRRNAQVAAVK